MEGRVLLEEEQVQAVMHIVGRRSSGEIKLFFANKNLESWDHNQFLAD